MMQSNASPLSLMGVIFRFMGPNKGKVKVRGRRNVQEARFSRSIMNTYQLNEPCVSLSILYGLRHCLLDLRYPDEVRGRVSDVLQR